MNKVVYVSSFGDPTGKNVMKERPTGEIKKGLFGGETEITEKVTEWVQTGNSDCKIDGKRLAEDIESAINILNTDGYEVVSVTPTTSGYYNWSTQRDGPAGYGFSYTEGVTIVAKKIA